MATEVRSALAEGAIQAFQGRLQGALLQPEDDGYDRARRVHNGMIDRRPALIVRCAGTADVVRAVDFALAHDLLISVRGGGHNVSGKAVCDGGLMIDLSAMKGIRVDPARQTARAQPGLTWGEFDHETQAFGLAVTGGQVSTTGIAGLTLGGGVGWLMRTCGFTVDNLLSVDLVTADGQVRTASADENEELFWGVRGGGGNFGIATSFEYRLHQVGPIILGGMVLFPASHAREVLRFYREYTATAPDELMAFAIVFTAPPEPVMPDHLHGHLVLAIAVCYNGSIQEGERAVAPLRAFGSPAVDLINPMPYTALQRMIDSAAPPGLNYYEKAHYLAGLGDDAIDVLVDHAARVTSPRSHIVLFPLGGAVSRFPEDHTAMGNRHASYNLLSFSVWEDPGDSDRHIRWTRELWTAMEPYSTGRVYVNFIGSEGEERVEAAYDPATYERLVALKNTYDPTNLFRLNHNIKPTV